MNIKEISERRPAGARAEVEEVAAGGRGRLRVQARPGLAEGAWSGHTPRPGPPKKDSVHPRGNLGKCRAFPLNLREGRCKRGGFAPQFQGALRLGRGWIGRRLDTRHKM